MKSRAKVKVTLLLLAALIAVCVGVAVTPSCGLFAPSAPPTTDYTAVDEASLGDDANTVELWIKRDRRLVDHRDTNGDTALHKAAFHGSLRVVSLLIQRHAPLDAQNNQGMTPLILASRADHLEIVRLLLGAKAKVDIRDNDGWTALRWAVAKKRDQTAQLLRAANGHE